jgi:hypothetical protein
MNSAMSEWQPVVLAPEDQLCIPLSGEALEKYREVRASRKTFRVRPNGRDFMCGGVAYEIHPDDRWVCHYEAPFVCEHQILAD